jgi:hypothetical protein
VIWLGVTLQDPTFTANNRPLVIKETSVKINFNYRISSPSELNETLLSSRVQIVYPLIKDLNIDKLAGTGRSPVPRLFR